MTSSQLVDGIMRRLASPAVAPDGPALRPVHFRAMGQGSTVRESAPVEARLGRWIIIGCALTLIASATFIRMDAAAVVQGTLGASSDAGAVQNRDGGAVMAIHVREGQQVRAGDILLELSTEDMRANERAAAASVISLQAERARLVAQIHGAATFTAPALFTGLHGDDSAMARDAMALQQLEFREWRGDSISRLRAMDSQQAQLSARIDGMGEQIQANRRQSELLDQEMTGLRSLAERGFASINRIRAMERNSAALAGDASNLRAAILSSRSQISEAKLQASAVSHQRAMEAGQRLSAVDQSLSDLVPRWNALLRQVEARRIKAPQSGEVLGLSVQGVGSVVAPGQILLHIVPRRPSHRVQITIAPMDADDIRPGMTALIRFPGVGDRSTLPIEGTVSRVSAASMVDERTGLRYYNGEIVLPGAATAVLTQLAATRSGQPAEVVIRLRPRTLLDYVLEPLVQAFRHSGSEH